MLENKEINELLIDSGTLTTKEDLKPILAIFKTITKILKELDLRIKKLEEVKINE